MLAFSAYLPPILVLRWGTFQISYITIAIDYVITAYVLGWILSVLHQKKSGNIHATDINHVDRSSDVAKYARMQRNDRIA